MTDETTTIAHIRRHLLPWRPAESTKTECGQRPAEFTHVITWDEVRELVGKLGKQRAALQVCMTCFNRSWSFNGEEYYRPWDDDPEALLARELNHSRRQDDGLMRRELRAIAGLIEAHPDEFAGLVHGLEQMVSPEHLAAKRAEKRYRRIAHKSRL